MKSYKVIKPALLLVHPGSMVILDENQYNIAKKYLMPDSIDNLTKKELMEVATEKGLNLSMEMTKEEMLIFIKGV